MSAGLNGDCCPVCEASQFEVRFQGSDRLYGTTSKNFQVVRCRECGLLRLHPRPGLSELLEYYPKDYWFAPEQSGAARMEELYRRVVLRDHIAFVHSALKDAQPGPVLDIGCGGALFGRLLSERGHRCFGLDFSHQAARVGWSVNRVPVVAGNFELAPFRPASFACITIFHVLEHLPSPKSALHAIHSLLVPGGHLIVQVPNASSWQFALFGRAWNGIDVPRHLVNYRTQDVQRILESSGFEVLRQKHFSLRDNPAGLATTVAPKLDPMARRIRGVRETESRRLLKDLVYLGIVATAIPFAALEAACGAGSTVMLHARKLGS